MNLKPAVHLSADCGDRAAERRGFNPGNHSLPSFAVIGVQIATRLRHLVICVTNRRFQGEASDPRPSVPVFFSGGAVGRTARRTRG